MKKIRKYTTVEEMFQYENKKEQDKHEVIMISNGYIVANDVPTFMQKNLTSCYIKSECTYIEEKDCENE